MKLQHIILIGTTVLYSVLFFTVPLYELVAAYLVFLFFIILNIVEFFGKKDLPILEVSKEELDVIAVAKEKNLNIISLMHYGALLTEEIAASGLLNNKNAKVTFIAFDASSEEQMDLALKIHFLNGKDNI